MQGRQRAILYVVARNATTYRIMYSIHQAPRFRTRLLVQFLDTSAIGWYIFYEEGVFELEVGHRSPAHANSRSGGARRPKPQLGPRGQ